VLAADRVFLDYGPMQVHLKADRLGKGMTTELQEAAAYGIEMLKELAEVLPLAKDKRTLAYPNPDNLPLPLRLMIEAVLVTKDQTLTPMAAVAGTFSDLLADWLVAKGATKVLINNGGDIAVRLLENQGTKIGLTPSIEAPSFTHILQLEAANKVGGITTSGFGGRSFTQGIASAVTVLARTSRVADACATLIGNYCYAEDPGIIRVSAETLDPNTDILGLPVTVSIGELRPETPSLAMSSGLLKAKELYHEGIIQGAVIFIGSQVAMLPEGLCQAI
ncbi:MAG: UPF0280 family protein, partial [Bacillota bacterium]|nr:UPF0280 family protein [Bacillota bacterium]